MAKVVKFIGKISKSGEDRNVIIIPKGHKEETDKMKGNFVWIVVSEIDVVGATDAG